MAKYAIFQVYDYKGGELSSNTNMSYTNFISVLSEKFENALYDFVEEVKGKTESRDRAVDTVLDYNDFNHPDKKIYDQVKVEVDKALKDRNFFSTYAGGDGFVGELYKIEGDTMTSVSFSSYTNDIARYITDMWVLEKDYETYALSEK